MTQKGPHTWDLIVKYHLCPKCNFIIESREGYQYLMGKYQKELTCPRCHNDFIVIKNTVPRFGPLFGEPTTIEWDWESNK